MQNNDISKILNMERLGFLPAVYSRLQHNQPTTAAFERSISMLRKLFAKDRNFMVENVKQ